MPGTWTKISLTHSTTHKQERKGIYGDKPQHLMWRADSLEKTLMLGKIESKRRRRWQRMRLLGSITNSMDMNLNKLHEVVKNREAWHAAVHGVTKRWTWLSDWTTTQCWKSVFNLNFFQSHYSCKSFLYVCLPVH